MEGHGRERRPSPARGASGKCGRTGRTGRTKRSKERVHLRRSHFTPRIRQAASYAQDEYRDDWQQLLDLGCTTPAIISNRLAHTARLLSSCAELLGADSDLGQDAALFARLTVLALEATELLHAVASEYQAWLEPAL